MQRNDQLRFFMASSESVKIFSRDRHWMRLNYCSWTVGFTSGLQQYIPKKTCVWTCNNLKNETFYDEKQSTPSVGWPQSFKEAKAEGDIQLKYPSDKLCALSIRAVTKKKLTMRTLGVCRNSLMYRMFGNSAHIWSCVLVGLKEWYCIYITMNANVMHVLFCTW